MAERTTYVIQAADLGALLESIRIGGFQLIGPTIREGAIVYDLIDGVQDLPVGWTDRQEAGSYRLERRSDGAFFGFVLGPKSPKSYLHPPTLRLFSIEKTRPEGASATADWTIHRPDPPGTAFAFIGIRPCELAGVSVQDRVFLEGPYVDPHYRDRRKDAFFLAVNCGDPAATCFCTSMKTGPVATGGYDLALTEVLGEEHRFVVEVGTDRGAGMLERVPRRPATEADLGAATAVSRKAAARMRRRLDTEGIKELLYEKVEHPRWDDVAGRCLACANCTMVCPTCFCTTVEDVSDLSSDHAERVRLWDSCYTTDFSYIHGGSIRSSVRSRYRQWLTHKLGSWLDQFGTSGCVGCGRCITWCPVGIDLTEEMAALRRDGEPDGERGLPS
jgi:sulfhydrogenase subunit beta (sulfur reductase)